MGLYWVTLVDSLFRSRMSAQLRLRSRHPIRRRGAVLSSALGANIPATKPDQLQLLWCTVLNRFRDLLYSVCDP
jgi:hypothetical protein